MKNEQDPSEPRRNAGGNPYIPKGDGDPSVKAYIEAMPEWKQDIGRELDLLITKLVPNVQKAVRWNTPFYGIEDQGWILAFYCYKNYVQITFLNGDQLSPPPPKPSKQKNVRYLDIYDDDRLDHDQLESWIVQAAALPGEDLF
ncbi:MAG: DUF1801 domain-containing protein [Pseudomonadales bacterium]|nr:DUF1801 domain-containing protein [Pseudomonadales bacterium]